MVKSVATPILSLINGLADGPSASSVSDQELLQRYCGQQDQHAFQALLLRHGLMVLNVCRCVLGNEADVEDAFQATFVVLVRRAGAIRKSSSLGSWLHGVAYRTALKARSQSTTRKKREALAPVKSTADPDDWTWREVQKMLHEELLGLAERYRAPLVLCYLGGVTQEAAAGQLRIAKSTLRERLERGRDLLRNRLVRRGLAPALLVAAAWPSAKMSASVPASLTGSTIKAASLIIAGKGIFSARVCFLTEGVLEGMSAIKRKVALAVLVVAAAVGLGLGTTKAPLQLVAQARDGALATLEQPPTANPDSPAPQTPKPADANVTVFCVDAAGKPISGVEVHLFQFAGGDNGKFEHAGPFTSDQQGKAICGTAAFIDEFGNFDRWVYARVSGRLVGVARCAKWTNRRVINPEFRVVMCSSRSVEGHVTVPDGFDPTKVIVQVRTLHVYDGRGELKFTGFPRDSNFPGLDTSLPEIFECRPDSKGRIRFSDVPVQAQLYLVTLGDGLAEAQWRNDGTTFEKPIEMQIEEESVFSGRVLSPDGKPVAGVNVIAGLSSFGNRENFFLTSFRAVTDEKGKFSIRGLPQTDFTIFVQDPKKRWTFRPLDDRLVLPHADPNMTLTMQTGILVSGRILDPEGKPVEAASISAVADSAQGSGLCHDMTDIQGRYQLRLPAGKARLYFSGLPDGFAYPKPQIVENLALKPGQSDIQDLNFTLQRK